MGGARAGAHVRGRLGAAVWGGAGGLGAARGRAARVPVGGCGAVPGLGAAGGCIMRWAVHANRPMSRPKPRPRRG